MYNKKRIVAALMATVFPITQFAYAQKVESDGDASIVTYEKEYFANYNAVTLLDMLQIIPGANDILNRNQNQGNGNSANARGGRGFGSGGDQILINGKRLAGKTNSIDDTLGRISADQVVKIELIRGATAGLDVQSQGLVINITLAGGASTSTTFVRLQNRYTIHHRNQPGALVSHSGSWDDLDYTFSIERKRGGFNQDRIEQFLDANDVKTADQVTDQKFDFKSFEMITNLSYAFNENSNLRLNGLYEPAGWDGLETRDRTSSALRPLTWFTDGDNDSWEVGGDYSRAVPILGSMRFLFLLNGNSRRELHNRFRGSGDQEFEYNIEDNREDRNERIFRLAFTSPLTQTQSLEYGAEAAVNTSDRLFRNEERDAVADEFELTNSDVVDIKENRYEVFAHHTYNITSRLVAQTSLQNEFSKIVANNVFAGGAPTRRDTSFSYFKPRLNLRYDISDRDQLRGTIEKRVSQLNFSNFVTRFDRLANVLRVGNTNIRPEQVWEYSIQYEHRFLNDGGSFDIELFYNRFTDYITRVDFSEYENFDGNPIGAEEFFNLPPTAALRDNVSFLSKLGNIPNATAYGIRANTSIRLSFLGLQNAVLALNYVYDKTEAIDQFTGNKRPFDWRSPHTFGFNFRHDLNDYGVSYGISGEAQTNRVGNDIDYTWPADPVMQFEAFAEYTFNSGIKIRIAGENIRTKRWDSRFERYDDHIRFNEFSGTLARTEKQATEIEFSVQATF